MTTIASRHLFGPGPTNPYPEATEGLARPLLGHLDPAFLTIMDETCERLREVWGTAQNRTLPLSATGSAGMEAAFVNTVHPGDVVVVAVNGLFGQRMCEVASRCGAEVVAVEHRWGSPVDPERVVAAHPAPVRERAFPCLRGSLPESAAASWEETFAVLIFGRVPMPALAPRPANDLSPSRRSWATPAR